MELCFATNNANKLREIEYLLSDKYRINSLAKIGCLEDIPEDQDTIDGNSIQKARYVYDRYGVNCFADDTGLEIDYLDGAPGVYSARYAGPQKKDSDNISQVLNRLKGVSNRKARFLTVVSLIIDGKLSTFEGIVNGTITTEISGEGGFGYDPIFKPDGYSLTFAQMPASEKNAISHRGQAIKKLVEYLSQ